MRDFTEVATVPSQQYAIENLEECRPLIHQCGLQAMEKAQQHSLTPIYFSSYPNDTGFDRTGSQATVASSQNYYKIRDVFSKI